MFLIILLGFISNILSTQLVGVTYSPYNTNGCLPTSQIEAEIVAIANYASKVRLFSSDCNQITTVLNVVNKQNLDLKLSLGIWTRTSTTQFQTDTQAVIKVLNDPNNSKRVESVMVGNEDIFNGVQEATVIQNINYVKKQVASNCEVKVPISTSEVHNLWSANLINSSDMIVPSVYPFYGNPIGDGSMDKAAQYTLSVIQNFKSQYPGKEVIIGETGYPNSGSAKPMNQFNTADQQNQCEYLDKVSCLASKSNLVYYVMEAKDALWKKGYSSENHFGILDSNNKLRCKISQCY